MLKSTQLLCNCFPVWWDSHLIAFLAPKLISTEFGVSVGLNNDVIMENEPIPSAQQFFHKDGWMGVWVGWHSFTAGKIKSPLKKIKYLSLESHLINFEFNLHGLFIVSAVRKQLPNHACKIPTPPIYSTKSNATSCRSVSFSKEEADPEKNRRERSRGGVSSLITSFFMC